MIFTSNYENAKKVNNLVSISMDGGHLANFEGPWLKELAPKENFYRYYMDNGKDEQYYISQYYYQVLRQNKYLLEELKKRYDGYGKDITLLSYASPDEFSHRYLVSSYLEIKYGIKVPELMINENGEYILSDYKPAYVKDRVLRLARETERIYH